MLSEENENRITRATACLTLFNGGHDLKTSPAAGFERRLCKFKAILCLRFLFCQFLQPCVQMNADADDHGKEGITLPGVDAHIMKVVII